jgi:tRNA threonylcarbamoyladenosine biosynthesis protein TsaB
MTVLGIETATPVCGVALGREDAVLVERSLNVGTHHAERLLPMIRDALGEAGMGLRDLDGIAVSIGPGSFTGLRIGLSTAKSLCWSAGLPLVAVSTLEAMAAQFPHAGCPVCPALDARKKEVYAALYDTSSGCARTLMAPAAVSPVPFVSSLAGPTLFVGDGARLYRREVVAALGERARFAPPPLDRPSAASVAALGLSRLGRGETEDLARVEPVYLRKSEAELKHGG